ncbi:DUF4231 domain-containing protein [Oscillatoria salina]|uniref:DUF4231 domain-containing protein n=1 Tax=Oscillatoria salina TaxID=331517 RepID=UPI0013B6DAAA|nr:DUF4231 domain-containing protein [Oscillatoria salina]MBZ8179867.1 DUF4231 domain-containing protein [Oscillatoria salina IIICB1]NET87109.1 DUF4231 domain-containing protein [Kamptonema sp. SIO1D9]
MTNSESTIATETSQLVTESLPSSTPKGWFYLKLIEYFFLAGFVYAVIYSLLLPGNKQVTIAGAAAIAIFLLLFLINRQLFNDYRQTSKQAEIIKKAELYANLMASDSSPQQTSIIRAREKALSYCQELIQDYKKTRRDSRNIYYISQISTVVLSGVTPILVLVDKLEAGIEWLKWLPVICPALAAIIASIVTSFPFQETWIAANTTVELLEAEQEKFILGVSQAYRCYDLEDETQRQKKAKQAIENFISQVNSIHLKQVQEAANNVQSGEENKESSESNPQKQPA